MMNDVDCSATGVFLAHRLVSSVAKYWGKQYKSTQISLSGLNRIEGFQNRLRRFFASCHSICGRATDTMDGEGGPMAADAQPGWLRK